jgi:hypothetical protein
VGAVAALLIAAMSWENFPSRPFVKAAPEASAAQEWFDTSEPEADPMKLEADFNPYTKESSLEEEGNYTNNFEEALETVRIPQLES